MAHFDNTSNEYLSNGNYNLDGREFMSIYSFKKKHNLNPNNHSSNGTEGQELISNKVECHTCKPDFGNFDKVFIYPINELEKFYGI